MQFYYLNEECTLIYIYPLLMIFMNMNVNINNFFFGYKGEYVIFELYPHIKKQKIL